MTTRDQPSPDRYARQASFAPLGREGQQRLQSGRVLICGCGALGSVLANTLVRAGVGLVRLVDRDFVELNNLQRQVLYTERDVQEHLPKAIAAQRHLAEINSEVAVEAVVADVTSANVLELLDGIDVIADGTDNFETRFLLNDAAFHLGIPWVFGGCIGAEGQTSTFIPGETGCLRCLVPDVPAAGTTPTCDTAGILGPVVNVIASLQATDVLKLLSGHAERVNRGLNVVELWENRLRQIRLAPLTARGGCRTCQQRDLEWLDGRRGNQPVVLCGRQAVQVSPTSDQPIDLAVLADRLQGLGSLLQNPYLLRLTVDKFVITVFRDGRAVVAGTDDPAAARTALARYIGQ